MKAAEHRLVQTGNPCLRTARNRGSQPTFLRSIGHPPGVGLDSGL